MQNRDGPELDGVLGEDRLRPLNTLIAMGQERKRSSPSRFSGLPLIVCA
jgi:hypothetical protein